MKQQRFKPQPTVYLGSGHGYRNDLLKLGFDLWELWAEAPPKRYFRLSEEWERGVPVFTMPLGIVWWSWAEGWDLTFQALFFGGICGGLLGWGAYWIFWNAVQTAIDWWYWRRRFTRLRTAYRKLEELPSMGRIEVMWEVARLEKRYAGWMQEEIGQWEVETRRAFDREAE